MRSLFIFIALTVPAIGIAQLHLAAGAGILNVDLSKKPVLPFYNDTADGGAARTIRIETDSTGELKLVSAMPVTGWLIPEQFFPAYDIFTFRVDTISGKWMRIFVNNGNGETMWLKEVITGARCPISAQEIREALDGYTDVTVRKVRPDPMSFDMVGDEMALDSGEPAVDLVRVAKAPEA